MRVALGGLAARRGVTALVLLVAVVAVAAAATGPLYDAAAQRSIVQQELADAQVFGRTVEATMQGDLDEDLDEHVVGTVAAGLSQLPAQDLLGAPVASLTTTTSLTGLEQSTRLAWRDGMCRHVRLVTGRCPAASGEVMASQAVVGLDGWTTGQLLPVPGLVLTLVGVYEPIDRSGDYWGTQAWFPGNAPASPRSGEVAPVDALLTSRATLADSRVPVSGTVVVDLPLETRRIRPRDVAALRATVDGLPGAVAGLDQRVGVSTTVASVLSDIDASRAALTVPVLLITAQLLALSWLLLFLVVTDAVEARGAEVALAKLRGFSRWQALRFGLAEPVAVLGLAVPVGGLVAWAATRLLSDAVLRAGTPVHLTWLGCGAAAGAALGGLVATALAARTTLSRSVTEQWRRADQRRARRGWVVDAVLVTGVLAGLVELRSSGTIGSASGSVLALLVPALLALALGVVASRLLPLVCQAGYARTRTHGGIGVFLALRQVARRPGGARTVMTVAVAFGLVTFTVAAWSRDQSDIDLVAAARAGAPTVLTVGRPQHGDLQDVVAAVDPSGRQAMAVTVYRSFAADDAPTLLAVDTQRFAAVADWRPGFAAQPLPDLLSRLHPPEPDPLPFDGDRISVDVSADGLEPATGFTLAADLRLVGGTAATPLTFGALAKGRQRLEAALPACPCTLRRLFPVPPPGTQDLVAGRVVVHDAEVHTAAGWRPVDVGLSDGRWQPDPSGSARSVSTGADGLAWTFGGVGSQQAAVVAYTWPHPLPALVSAAVARPADGPFDVGNVDGASVTALPVAAVAVPGAPERGVLVDRTYALRAAYGIASVAEQQVWLSGGTSVDAVRARLAAAGVEVLGATSLGELRDGLARRGPALALVLFLAEAVAAAVLAVAAAVLALHQSGRRRSYELAALQAAGARAGPLRTSLLVEQALTLGTGLLAGAVAGVGAALLALRSLPVFLTPPAAPALDAAPQAAPLAALVGVAVLVLAASTAWSSLALVRGVRADRLREGPA